MHAIIDHNGRELQDHGTLDFPCAAYHTSNTGFPWHWHEELEMIYVEAGSLVVAVADGRYPLRAGEGIVINANAPHAVIPNPCAEYKESDIVFHPRLLYGSTDSVLYAKHVSPFLHCETHKGIPLLQGVAWQEEAAQCIRLACDFCQRTPPFYAFEVRNLLTRIFVSVFTHIHMPTTQPSVQSVQNTQRIQDMMRFVLTHMHEEITLAQLAGHAHLSTRECQRAFVAYIGLSPMQYVSQIRLARAAELLRNEAASITDICFRCGFQSPSYFGKKFRARYGMTPRQYQKAGTIVNELENT